MLSQGEYGLVLSGGGAKGAFEMGVWKAIRECDYPIGAVIGTSVGAINAAMIAQNNFDAAMEFWSKITITHVLNLSKTVTNNYVETWSKESFDTFRDGFLTLLFSDGFDITPLRNNLTRLISEEAIRRSSIRFGLVTVDLTSLKPKQLMIEDIPQGQLIDYLLASAALPIFQKQEIDGKTYLDGGFFDNVPINFMLEQNFHQIISVEFPVLAIRKWVRNKNIKIITVNNSEFLGGTLNFNSKTIDHSIQLGYLDAMKTFGALEGKYYYIDTQKNNTIFKRFETQLGLTLSDTLKQQKLIELLHNLKATDKNNILSGLEDLLKKTTFRNRPLALSLLEITAKSLGVPRLEKYSIDLFFQAILKKLGALMEENLTLLENPRIVMEFLLPANNNFRRYNFITFYIVFMSIPGDLSRDKMNAFLCKFTPDISLSMITLFYIHEMLKK
ncbi:patatin-like phospholipase family protein [Acetobacterium sp.]|uniref:patatin-like phospholipase family protein n=1 Tax=Acetobacterium sp. TaxID=1872094 RepID=UPI002F424CB9